MKKHTQRELINELTWAGVGKGIGKGIGRAGLGLLRAISPKAGALADKLLKVDDKQEYSTPKDAVKGTIKYLLKSGQIKDYQKPNVIDEIDATNYVELRDRAAGREKPRPRLKTFDLSQSKLIKYFLVSSGVSSSFTGDSRNITHGSLGFMKGKTGMLFTVVKTPSANRLETAKWKVEKVEDATPALPEQKEEQGKVAPTPATKSIVAAAAAKKAARPKPITRVPLRPRAATSAAPAST